MDDSDDDAPGRRARALKSEALNENVREMLANSPSFVSLAKAAASLPRYRIEGIDPALFAKIAETSRGLRGALPLQGIGMIAAQLSGSKSSRARLPPSPLDFRAPEEGVPRSEASEATNFVRRTWEAGLTTITGWPEGGDRRELIAPPAHKVEVQWDLAANKLVVGGKNYRRVEIELVERPMVSAQNDGGSPAPSLDLPSSSRTHLEKGGDEWRDRMAELRAWVEATALSDRTKRMFSVPRIKTKAVSLGLGGADGVRARADFLGKNEDLKKIYEGPGSGAHERASLRGGMKRRD